MESTTIPPVRRNRRNADQWRELLDRFEQSGQTQEQFCAEHDLGLSTFSRWRKRLRRKLPVGSSDALLVELSQDAPAFQPNVTPFSDARREPAPAGKVAAIPQGWDELVATKQQWMGRINAAWRCKWILVFSLIVGLAWGAYRVIEQTPMYRASLSLLLHHYDTYTQQKNVVPGSEDAALSVHNQQELIRSRNMAERVVDSLSLEKRSPLLNIPERRFQTGWVGWIASRLDELRAQSARSEKTAGAVYSREALVSMVQGSLKTRGRTNTEILDISVSFQDPDLAMEVANAYAIQFIAMQQEDAIQIANSTSAWLTERITELKQALDDSERNLQAYRLEQGIGDTKSLVSQSNSKLRELESEVEQRNELYQLYLGQLGMTNLAAKLDQKQSKIIDIATRPSSPYSPDEGAILRNTMVWSVALGLMIVSLLVFMHNKFRFPEQAEQILGFPVLGALPLLRGRELSGGKGQPVAPEFFHGNQTEVGFLGMDKPHPHQYQVLGS